VERQVLGFRPTKAFFHFQNEPVGGHGFLGGEAPSQRKGRGQKEKNIGNQPNFDMGASTRAPEETMRLLGPVEAPEGRR